MESLEGLLSDESTTILLTTLFLFLFFNILLRRITWFSLGALGNNQRVLLPSMFINNSIDRWNSCQRNGMGNFKLGGLCSSLERLLGCSRGNILGWGHHCYVQNIKTYEEDPFLLILGQELLNSQANTSKLFYKSTEEDEKAQLMVFIANGCCR